MDPINWSSYTHTYIYNRDIIRIEFITKIYIICALPISFFQVMHTRQYILCPSHHIFMKDFGKS